jgi:hypothetical protein
MYLANYRNLSIYKFYYISILKNVSWNLNCDNTFNYNRNFIDALNLLNLCIVYDFLYNFLYYLLNLDNFLYNSWNWDYFLYYLFNLYDFGYLYYFLYYFLYYAWNSYYLLSDCFYRYSNLFFNLFGNLLSQDLN